MARVSYGALVTNISGSIGGSTFQLNNSGATARAKPQQKFFPSTLQSGSRSDFANISTSWSTLSLSVQALWNAYALANPITDRWGNIRTLTGFQYYMQSNLNLLSLGLTLLASPPTYVAPDIVPTYEVIGYSNSLHIDFYPAINFPNSDLVIYATAPTTATKLTNRKNLYLIGGFSSPNAGIFDITSMYAAAFGLTWQSFFDYANCNIIFQLMLVNRVTGIASPFNGYVFPIRNYPHPNLATLGTSFTNLGTQFGQTILLSLLSLGSGIVLASTANTAKILRSTDSGSTWSDLGSPFAQTGIYNFATNGIGIAVCGSYSNGHIFRSTDYGVNWVDLGQISTLTDIRSIAYCGDAIFLGYCSPNGTIIRSSDNGSTWSVITTIATGTALGSVLYLENGICLAFSPNANIIYRSTDYGLTWAPIVSGISYNTPRQGVYCGNGLVIVGCSSNGWSIKSLDYGLTWSNNNTITGLSGVFAMKYIGFSTILVGGSTSAILLISKDNGSTWVSLGSQFSQAVLRCVEFISPQTVLAGTSNNAYIIKSTA
jgi:photosystem II stability/assembly factor-like uncharacterized protein